MSTNASNMSKCAICGAKIVNPDPMEMLFLFHSEKSGREYFGCEKCAEQLSRMMEARNSEEADKARDYFESHIRTAEDPEMRDYLKTLLESNAAAAKNTNRRAKERENAEIHQEDFSANDAPGGSISSGWIKWLRTAAWVTVIFGIISGLVIGASLFQVNVAVGILMMALFAVISLLSVSALMVFLNMAEDIRSIRLEIEKKK